MLKKTRIMEYGACYKIIEPNSDVENLLENLETIDYHTRERIPLGYFYNKEKDTYSVPKGIGKAELFKHLKINKTHDGGFLDVGDRLIFKMRNNPFKKQSKIINNVFINFKRGDTQAIVDMPTGRGKTFAAIYLTHKLKRKPIIFVKNGRQCKQWAEGFKNHTHINMNKVFIARGKSNVHFLFENGDDYDIFITTHRTVSNFIRDNGYKKLNQWFLSMGVNLKIFDEFDLAVENMLRIDCHSSFRYNLYLTATPFKSGYYDNQVFKYAFKNVYQLGKDLYANETPNRDAHIIFLKSNPTKKEKGKCYSYKNTGDKWEPFFDPDKYHKYIIKKKKILKSFLDIPMRDVKNKIKKYPNRKHIFFTGKIENCEIIKNLLVNDYNVKPSIIGIYNSDIDKSEKDKALNQSIIISISSSMGRALDIKNLETLIDMESYRSASIFIQLIGRVGRVGGLRGKWYKMFDTSFYRNYFYYKSLKSYIHEEFDNIEYQKLPEIN
ncbi:MAG: DEAD/DEAH box helicase [Candidatus Woesearchaeota archaeon]